MKTYSYVFIPTLCIPESIYELFNGLFIYPIFTKTRENFFQCCPGKRVSFAIALCKEHVDSSDPLEFDLIEDYVLFHCFISQDSSPYEWFVKVFNGKLIHSFRIESREGFIKSLKKDPINSLASEFKKDFEHFPLYEFDEKYKISYSEAFRKFLQAKNEGRKIYEYIRLYDFAANLSQINPLYDNIALSLSLLYTILDAFLGSPKYCSKKLTCENCGNKNISHQVESLASYHRRKIDELLKSQERSLKENYLKLLKIMNEIRSKTYHGAIFYSIFDEWLKEAKTKRNLGPKAEAWTLERIKKEFKSSYLAKSLADWLFSSFIRALLLNELLKDRYYPRLLMDLIT